MILILSENTDSTTTDVVKWLINKNQKFIRVNKEDKIEILNIDIDNDYFIIKSDRHVIDSRDISHFWYRRGDFNLSHYLDKITVYENLESYEDIKDSLKNELFRTNEVLHLILRRNSKCISNYFRRNLNKLEVLKRCIDFDIQVAPTMITSQSNELSKFQSQSKSIINKPIYEVLRFKDKHLTYSTYTSEVPENIEEEFDVDFFPSLFQKQIEKQFEIRTFYLLGKTYSMAIFTPPNTLSAVDFRHYYDQPNMHAICKLPVELDEKIDKLMKSLDINSGSIDFIKTPDDEYIFLEVNPVGQFGMVSKPCNYNLEKILADELTK